MIELPNGQLIETEEETAARHRVRAFHFGRYREAVPEIAEPIIADHAGIYEEHTVVTPRPSSLERRYGLTADGKKSHHPLHKCADCPAICCGSSPRCPECRAARRKLKQGAAQHKIYMRHKAAKLPSVALLEALVCGRIDSGRGDEPTSRRP